MTLTFGIVTLFPEMFSALDHGIVGRAKKNQLIEYHFFNPRDFTNDAHQTVDDRPYGGGPGMVMKFEPLHAAIQAAKNVLGPQTPVILLTPQGKPLIQKTVRDFALRTALIFVCGRYEGIDERLIQADIDEEWSIGDYVVSGGELPTMVCIDALTRLLPNALGHEDSASQDSFSAGLLDYPHYTRPELIANQNAIPDVLLSGDHQAINRWRQKQSLGRTWQRRQDLLKIRTLSDYERGLLEEYLRESAKIEPEETT